MTLGFSLTRCAVIYSVLKPTKGGLDGGGGTMNRQMGRTVDREEREREEAAMRARLCLGAPPQTEDRCASSLMGECVSERLSPPMDVGHWSVLFIRRVRGVSRLRKQPGGGKEASRRKSLRASIGGNEQHGRGPDGNYF